MATDTLTGPAILGGTTRTRVFKNFIDGEWVESQSGQTFEDRNPADTREVGAIFQRSNKEDVEAAVDAAVGGDAIVDPGRRLYAAVQDNRELAADVFARDLAELATALSAQ